MKDFEDFLNEEFLGIDLKKIKKAAFDYHSTKECRQAMLEIKMSLLDSVVKEVLSLKNRYGLIDNLAKKLIAKANSQNEGVLSTILLTTFGIHATLKMLAALKNGWSLGHYLGRLFYRKFTSISWKKIFLKLDINSLLN